MRCPSCGNWNADERRRRCSNCGAALEPVPDYLGRAIAATLLVPLAGLLAVYFSVRTNRSLAAGDYFAARRHSRLARAWAHAAFWLVLATLMFVGTYRLLQALQAP